MCGIWALIGSNGNSNGANGANGANGSSNSHNNNTAYCSFKRIETRGPDRSYFIEHKAPYDVTLGFHRLSIMDPSIKGDQPFTTEYTDSNGVDRIVNVICNGEIYNFKAVAKDLGLESELKSGSDCEIIIRAYCKYGATEVVKRIRGEFAFVIVDMEKQSGDLVVHAARDPFGIRPLFIDQGEGYVNFCSELKGIVSVYEKRVDKSECLPVPFKGGSLLTINRVGNVFSEPELERFYEFPEEIKYTDLEQAKKLIVHTLTESVESKLVTDRPLGCLLSGGLDSSLITAIAARHLHKIGKRLRTFSIGIEGSTDEPFARIVAEHCDTDHTHVEFEQQVWLDALKAVIMACETFDITTIRASTGQYLISKWVSENTDIKVLLIGDGSDELTSGYLYFHKSPSAEAADEENRLLLDEISYYDVLRADRGIASNGLEARVPFLDTAFVDLYLSIDPALRAPTNGVEKWLLRESFNGTGLLPNQILFRKKEAFSDGVSSKKKSWYTIIQEHANEIYSDNYFGIRQQDYKRCTPPTKEALLYREWFESFFGKGLDHVIPHYWMPKWCGEINEPSARVLEVYK